MSFVYVNHKFIEVMDIRDNVNQPPPVIEGENEDEQEAEQNGEQEEIGLEA